MSVRLELCSRPSAAATAPHGPSLLCEMSKEVRAVLVRRAVPRAMAPASSTPHLRRRGRVRRCEKAMAAGDLGRSGVLDAPADIEGRQLGVCAKGFDHRRRSVLPWQPADEQTVSEGRLEIERRRRFGEIAEEGARGRSWKAEMCAHLQLAPREAEYPDGAMRCAQQVGESVGRLSCGPIAA